MTKILDNKHIHLTLTIISAISFTILALLMDMSYRNLIPSRTIFHTICHCLITIGMVFCMTHCINILIRLKLGKPSRYLNYLSFWATGIAFTLVIADLAVTPWLR